MDWSSIFSSAPSSSSPNWKYDVFLSFHPVGIDRYFVDLILEALRSKKINSFIDNYTKRGTLTAPELIESIRGSRVAIVLLSRDYASSSCLDELAEIMNCKEELGQVVIPIFCDLDPIDVKKQTERFGKIFRETCKGKTKQEMRRWSQDLTDVSTIAGYRSRTWLVFLIFPTHHVFLKIS